MTDSALGFEFARRARNRGDAELNAILAGAPPGVLSLMGGFPHPATFPADALDELVAGLLRDDPAGALQYTPVEGIPSVREFLLDRIEQLQGRRPDLAELIVTSGGMECIALAGQALVDPGDTVVVEAPTYLGALMAFAGVEADVVGIPMDSDGMLVDALEERLATGLRPKLVYVIPEFQNPSGRTLSLERRRALVSLCRRYGVVVLEDVAYREIGFSDDAAPPTLWSLAPDVVVQAGTFSKIFCPGVRLGWATGPREVIAQLAAAKQTTDQCAGGLGQRIVEAYGRAGSFERRLPSARALYASHWRAVQSALQSHMPPTCRWSEPEGGFFTWLEVPGVDTRAMRVAALEAGVAYVPGAPFYPRAGGSNELRVSFSYLDEEELEEAVVRLAGVVGVAMHG
jgi:2-aminoadipate transaminase